MSDDGWLLWAGGALGAGVSTWAVCLLVSDGRTSVRPRSGDQARPLTRRPDPKEQRAGPRPLSALAGG